MVPLFVGYALYFWWLVAGRRRSLRGLGMVGLSVLGLFGVHLIHIWLASVSGGVVQLPMLRALLVPYAILVAAVGLFVLSIPRERPGPKCLCGYSLDGLSDEDARVTCPECGRVQTMAGAAVYRPSGMDRVNLRSSDVQTVQPGATNGDHPGSAPRVITRAAIRGSDASRSRSAG